MSTITGTAALAFRELNTDGNSKISTSELKKGAALLPAAVRQTIAKSGAKSVLNDMDADGDGALTKQELADGIASLTSSTAASVLLKAQESQSQTSQMLVGLKSGAYSSLVNINTDSTTTAMQNVLAAYSAGSKV